MEGRYVVMLFKVFLLWVRINNLFMIRLIVSLFVFCGYSYEVNLVV